MMYQILEKSPVVLLHIIKITKIKFNNQESRERRMLQMIGGKDNTTGIL